MKLCKDCKHLVDGILCACPSNPVNPVDGLPYRYFASVCRIRGNTFGNDCDPEAKHFEEKESSTHTVKWWAFWRTE